MIKKLNISSQLFIIFASILLFASCAFSIITLVFVNNVAEEQVFARLNSYVGIMRPDREGPGGESSQIDSGPLELKDMEVGYLHVVDGTKNTRGIQYYITEEELESLVASHFEEYKENYNNNNQNNDEFSSAYTSKGNVKTSVEKVFYVIRIFDENNYSIVFTDTSYSNNLIIAISMRLIIAFFILLLLAICVLMIWSGRFVSRINAIQNHILSLPKSKYKNVYIDNSKDELGKLSLSVDSMRKEIALNEATKQEMLQNLSHDFKTPIAVIKSYAEAMQDNVLGEEALKTIIEQSDILKHKVERLLQYNSLEYLDKSKPFEDVCMNEIITEVVTQYRLQTSLEIEVEIDGETFYKGYKENWYTVVSNIVDNAKRYAKTKIKICLKKDILTIFNDGEPIDEQFVKSSFKPYEKGSKGQFGLGMSIVQKTVYFFGYNLSVRNEETGGVSFVINK